MYTYIGGLEKMKVLYFAMLREKLGRHEEHLGFSGTVGEFRKLLIQKYPELRPIIEKVRFAVNEEYVDDEHFLRGDETVAIIPPVSGG
ncbi:MAG: molybdopterin converting factor subunit 1 [Aquificaceae bacterium]|nr:molybdopterin converting factor subunit 1 [Aquificaceae bacterium]MDW8434482.1 molybdopterin converting factor subunit 1 [Aquificaceae bacterium]